MITDGYWNGGDAGVGNVDNTAGSTISGAGGRSFRYNRERPYRDDTSNSLADTAMYYWVRDLRTDLDNKGFGYQRAAKCLCKIILKRLRVFAT